MKLTDQNKIDIVNRYIKGESSVKLGEDFNVTRQAILAILRNRKVEIRSKNGRE